MLKIIFVLESFSASIFQPYESGKAKLWRCQNIGGSMGEPHSWMVYFMEHPIEMDDVGVPPWIGNLFVPKYRWKDSKLHPSNCFAAAQDLRNLSGTVFVSTTTIVHSLCIPSGKLT